VENCTCWGVESSRTKSEVLVSTSLVQPDQTGCFKVLIENHGRYPVNLEANHVMGVLASASPVPMEKVPGLWEQQFESVGKDGDIMLCHMQPMESLLQTVPVNWQSLEESEAVQFQSLVQEYADVFAIDPTEVGRTDLVEHNIETAKHPPIKQPPCRIPFSLHPKVEKFGSGNVKPRSCEGV